uniref:Uncharacterized protein n=1 Tax=Micrurus spixii TaxID=129469 RepID=A0A2D4MUG6_9SAUR
MTQPLSTPPPTASSQCQEGKRRGVEKSWGSQGEGRASHFDLFKYSHNVPNTLREIKQKLFLKKEKEPSSSWQFLRGHARLLPPPLPHAHKKATSQIPKPEGATMRRPPLVPKSELFGRPRFGTAKSEMFSICLAQVSSSLRKDTN